MLRLAIKAFVLYASINLMFPFPGAFAVNVKKLTYNSMFGRSQLYVGKDCYRLDCFWGSGIVDPRHIFSICNLDSEKFVSFKNPTECAKSLAFTQKHANFKQISNWKKVGGETIQGFKTVKYVRSCSRMQAAVHGGKSRWIDYRETIWTTTFPGIPAEWVGPCATAIGCDTPGGMPLRKEFSDVPRPLVDCIKRETVDKPDDFFRVPTAFSKAKDVWDVVMGAPEFAEPVRKARPD
jgi:hypothetical protein